MKKMCLIVTVMVALLSFTACNSPGDSTSITTEEETAVTEVTAMPALKEVAEEANEDTEAETADTTTDARANADASTNEIDNDAASESDATSRTDEGEPLITYERKGGLKGIGPNEYVWHIYADGRVTSNQDQSWQVAPEEVEALLTSINIDNFRSLETNYVSQDECCDLAQYTITIQTEGQVYKVTTIDNADMPDTLSNTLTVINAFLMDLQ